MKKSEKANVSACSLAEYLFMAFSILVKQTLPQPMNEKLGRIRRKAERSELN